MKAMYSKILTTAALLALSIPVTAFSEMKDMSVKDHRYAHGQMMEMGDMDKMGDMMGMCIEHAGKMGLSDAQITKLKPIHREMEKKTCSIQS